MVAPSLHVAEILDFSVADMRFVKPLDEALILQLARAHDYLIVTEENAVQGGAGSAVLELLAKNIILKPVLLVGIADIVTEHGNPERLMDDLGLSNDGLLTKIRTWSTKS